MKIALPLISEEELAIDFAKSKFIGIYDDKSHTLEFLIPSNSKQIADSSVFYELQKIENLKYIISPSLSFMALRVFKEYNFQVFQSKCKSVTANIEFFKKNALLSLNSVDAYLYECGSGSCNSCKSTCSLN